MCLPHKIIDLPPLCLQKIVAGRESRASLSFGGIPENEFPAERKLIRAKTPGPVRGHHAMG
jgi:hypothetical protein